jgi:hypothetical protein
MVRTCEAIAGSGRFAQSSHRGPAVRIRRKQSTALFLRKAGSRSHSGWTASGRTSRFSVNLNRHGTVPHDAERPAMIISTKSCRHG